MQCLLIYDIPDDRARQRVSDACLDFGLQRVQYSAFIGTLTRIHQRELLMVIQQRIGRKTANIQLFPLNEASWRGRRVIEQQGEDGDG